MILKEVMKEMFNDLNNFKHIILRLRLANNGEKNLKIILKVYLINTK
jgi:hypothetical protein